MKTTPSKINPKFEYLVSSTQIQDLIEKVPQDLYKYLSEKEPEFLESNISILSKLKIENNLAVIYKYTIQTLIQQSINDNVIPLTPELENLIKDNETDNPAELITMPQMYKLIKVANHKVLNYISEHYTRHLDEYQKFMVYIHDQYGSLTKENYFQYEIELTEVWAYYLRDQINNGTINLNKGELRLLFFKHNIDIKGNHSIFGPITENTDSKPSTQKPTNDENLDEEFDEDDKLLLSMLERKK